MNGFYSNLLFRHMLLQFFPLLICLYWYRIISHLKIFLVFANFADDVIKITIFCV